MIMKADTIRIKFKNLVAQRIYNKKWSELSTVQQNELRSKHRRQFDIFSRKVREGMNDHDLLVEVNTILKELKTDFDNHLRDHKKYMFMAWTTSIGLIVTLITLLIKIL